MKTKKAANCFWRKQLPGSYMCILVINVSYFECTEDIELSDLCDFVVGE